MIRVAGAFFLLLLQLLAVHKLVYAASPLEYGCPKPARILPKIYTAVVEKDLTYVKRGSEILRIDVARPDRRGRYPAILFVHGGAWWGGSKNDYAGEIESAAERGFVAASLDYRVSSDDNRSRVKNPFPAHISDVKAAIRWLRSHAEYFQIQEDQLGILGGSAGGHLALLAGLTPDRLFVGSDESNLGVSSTPDVIVNYYGPTDLQKLTQEDPNLESVIRKVFEDLDQASPVYYLNRNSPPILTLHGSEDDTVSFKQAEHLSDQARAVGASHQLVRCEGEGHGFNPENRRVALELSFNFFDRQFGHPLFQKGLLRGKTPIQF